MFNIQTASSIAGVTRSCSVMVYEVVPVTCSQQKSELDHVLADDLGHRIRSGRHLNWLQH